MEDDVVGIFGCGCLILAFGLGLAFLVLALRVGAYAVDWAWNTPIPFW